MLTKRRWLRSVLETSKAPPPALPWTRGLRRKPVALLPVQPSETVAPRRRAG